MPHFRGGGKSTDPVLRIRLGSASGSELVSCVIIGEALPLSGPQFSYQSHKEVGLGPRVQTGRPPADSDLQWCFLTI